MGINTLKQDDLNVKSYNEKGKAVEGEELLLQLIVHVIEEMITKTFMWKLENGEKFYSLKKCKWRCCSSVPFVFIYVFVFAFILSWQSWLKMSTYGFHCSKAFFLSIRLYIFTYFSISLQNTHIHWNTFRFKKSKNGLSIKSQAHYTKNEWSNFD